MSSGVTRISPSPPRRQIASYASSTSSSDDDGSQPPLEQEEPSTYLCNELPRDIITRLQLSEEQSFNLLMAAQFDDRSDDSEHSEETASNGSSVGATPRSPIPYATMDDCIANSSTGIPLEADPDFKEDDCSQDLRGWSSLREHGSNLSSQISSSTNHSVDDKSQRPSSTSKTVMSTLKKRWRYVKKASVKSSTYFSSTRDAESWEDRHSRIGDEWVNSIIPLWRKKRKTARVRTLVFRGIPANVRGRVWRCAIGNPLNISEELFIVLKDRAAKGREEYIRLRDTVALADGDVGGNGGRAEAMLENERSAHKAINLDLPRTFPELTFFHAEGSHYEHALRDVLEAFLYLKPDVGYSQGMSFVAAVLLLYMDAYDAFACFANMLLYKSCFLHFFRIKMPEVRCYLVVHERLLADDMPALHAHFRQHGINADLYMINWVMSLYCRALPLDLVTRIWDLYVLDGDVAIFRAALGILRMFMPKLLKMKFEEMAYFLSHIPADEIDADGLLQSIRCVRVVTRRRFYDLFKDCRSAVDKCDSSVAGNR